MASVEKWKAPNGNMCFNLTEHNTYKRPWIIIATVIIAFAICSMEFYVFKSCFLLVPIVIILFLLIYISEKSNDTIIANTVHDIMNSAIKDDAEAMNLSILKSKVEYDCKGTYGIIEATYLLVLLDNEEVWEYPIHIKSNQQGTYFECERNYTACINQKHIRKILPKRWSRFISTFKLSEKTKLGLLLTAILVFGCLTCVGLYMAIVVMKWWLILILGSYFSICFFIKWLYEKWNNGFMYNILQIISVPFIIMCFLIQAAAPFVTIVGTYFFLILFTFGVPAIILKGLSFIGWFSLKPETIAFIVFAIGSILCSSSYDTTKWILHHSPLRDRGNHTYELYREELALYLAHPTNVIFMLYSIYFVLLVLSGFQQIENGGYLLSQGWDTAILKSFLVLIAFTNMRSKAKDAQIEVKDLFQRTLKLFTHNSMLDKNNNPNEI